MKAIIKYVLINALRDKIFACLFFLLLASLFFSVFIGNISLVEKSYVIISFFNNLSRYILVLGMFVFISFYTQKLFDTKEIEAILTKPISREKFVVSYFFGFAFIAMTFWAFVTLFFAFFAKTPPYNVFCWSFSFLCELLICVSIAVFFSIGIKKAIVSFFSSVGFYILARASFFINYIAQNKTLGEEPKYSDVFFAYITKTIDIIMPRLDLFSNSSLLIYNGAETSLGFIFSQTIVYCCLILCACMFDFNKKNF